MLPPRKLAIVRRMGDVATHMERLQAQFERLERDLLEAGGGTPRGRRRRHTRGAGSSPEKNGNEGDSRSSKVPPARSLETRVLDLFQSGDPSLRVVDVMERLGEWGGVADALRTLVDAGRIVRGIKGHHKLAPANEPLAVRTPVPLAAASTPSVTTPQVAAKTSPPRRRANTLSPKKPKSTEKVTAPAYLINADTKQMPWDEQLKLFAELHRLRAPCWIVLLESQRFAPLVLKHLAAQSKVELPDEFQREIGFVSSRPTLRVKISSWCASVDPFSDVLRSVVSDLDAAGRGNDLEWVPTSVSLTLSHRSWLGRCHDALAELNAVRGRLAATNIRLVMKLARSRIGIGGLDFSDLINESFFGLLRAVDRFEPERGLKFSTYATWWVRQASNRALQNTGRAIRLPVHFQQFYCELRAARSHVGTDASAIAKHLGVPLKKVVAFELTERNVIPVPRPLDEPVRGRSPGEEGSTLGEMLTSDVPDPHELIVEHEAAQMVRGHLDRLIPRDAEVLRRRFGVDCEPQTLSQIGDDFGLSRERIRQIQTRALESLRKFMDGPAPIQPVHLPAQTTEIDETVCGRVLSFIDDHGVPVSASPIARRLHIERWEVRRACVELVRRNLLQKIGIRFAFLRPAEEKNELVEEDDPPVQLVVNRVDQRVLSCLEASPDQLFGRPKIGKTLGLEPWAVRGAMGRLLRIGVVQQVGTRFRAARPCEPTEDTVALPSSVG